MTLPDITDRKTFPDMTRWFKPSLLIRLLTNAVISQVFGQYADRRLMIAALDTVKPDELIERTRLQSGKGPVIQPRADGVFWFDFVADLGDGFDPTYAIAKLLGKESLVINGTTLPRGQMVIMGGDEVYPVASREAYANQLGVPYRLAFPDHNKPASERVPLFAVPGNHDWYDGLVMFLAFFCGVHPWHIGGWSTPQRRSYFALQLTDRWWLWCTDIQLDDDMDDPQETYFRLIAGAMPEGSKVILCSAEPGWLYTHKTMKPYAICEYSAGLATRYGKNVTVPIILSGDTHHYSHYTADNGNLFITSGGGGAFLHPTHQLSDTISLPQWLQADRVLNLNAEYPSRAESRGLLWRDVFFAFTNAGFSLFLGTMYWLFGLLMNARPQWDAYIATFLFFAAALTAYTVYQERTPRIRNWLVSLAHALAHTIAIYLIWTVFASLNERFVAFSSHWHGLYEWLALTFVEVAFVGAVVGGTVFGVYLLLTCAFLDMNHNDAFSAMRIKGYKNFLRICIEGNEVRIYPIGLTKVPQRHEWTKSKNNTTYEPIQELNPHLIEDPIILRV